MGIKFFKHTILKYILFSFLLLKGGEFFAFEYFYSETPIKISLLDDNDSDDYDSLKDGKYDGENCCDEIKNTDEAVLFCSLLHSIRNKKNNYCSVHINSSIYYIEHISPPPENRL